MAEKKNKTSSVLDMSNSVTADELARIINMQLDEMDENPDCVDVMAPLFIHGSPGCGKSSIVRQICKDRNIEFIDFRASQCESCDIRGLPVPNREKNQMDWFVNGVWPRDPDGKGIIFLDELSSADRSIQVSLYQLVLDRNLGSLYKVPKGYLIVSAGNLTTDRAVATTMSSALANRFMHVTLREDAEAWVSWARDNDIHPAVIGFIQYKPALLFNMDGENLERGWPTPRSWERVSQLCHMFKNKDELLLRKLVYGTVGNGAGVEFMSFYKINAEFANILDIMTNPDAEIKIPVESDRKYALCSSMVYLLWRGTTPADEARRIDGFFRISMCLTPDFASMALLAAISSKDKAATKYRSERIFRHKAFSAWNKKYGKSLRKNIDLTAYM